MPTIRELFPAFSEELEKLLAERPDLATQIPDLPVVGRCTCGESNCAQFYTASHKGPFGFGHSNLILDANAGDVILDLVNDKVVSVEVLDRPDVKVPLDAAFPLPE